MDALIMGVLSDETVTDLPVFESNGEVVNGRQWSASAAS